MMDKDTSSITGMEVKIVNFLLQNSGEQFAVREIARKMKVDYKHVHSTIQKLAKKNILRKMRKANVDLCSLNLKENLSAVYYTESERTRMFLEAHLDLKEFFKSVTNRVKTNFYILLVFGSFAKGKEHKNSDLDLLIVSTTRSTSEEIERIISNEALFLKRKVQSVFLDEKEFSANILDRSMNVVKEALKNHVLIFGAESFYQEVKKL